MFTSTSGGNTDKESDRVVIEAAKELKRKYGLELVGIGGGTSLENKIHTISMSLELNRLLSKDEARKMMVDAGQILLAKINNNEKIKSLLEENPFPYSKIKISFFLNKPNGDNIFHPDFDIISLFLGNINYCTCGEDGPYPYKEKIEEPFEEAVKIVEQQKLQKP